MQRDGHEKCLLSCKREQTLRLKSNLFVALLHNRVFDNRLIVPQKNTINLR
jgi:hypothetical protein